MNDNVTTLVILALVVLAAIVVIGLIVRSMRKRKAEENRVRAAELRQQAAAHAAGLPEAQARADEQAALAEQRRLEAQEAEQRAAEAHQELAQQQALHEEQVRTADRLDPDVNHRSKGYTPQTAAAETTPASEQYDATGRTTPDSGSHRGSTSGDPDTVFDGDQHGTTGATPSGHADDPVPHEGQTTTGAGERRFESPSDGTYVDENGVLRNADGSERPVPGQEGSQA